MSRLGIEASVRPSSSCPALEAHAFSSGQRWTVVIWPPYFNLYDIGLARELSGALDTVVSTVHEFDNDYWTHVLFDRGRLVDRFASWPDYFAETDDEARALRMEWAGHPQEVAAVIGVPASVVAPYFVYAGEDLADRKAFADDEFELGFFWVFTDLWRRLGISYPDDLGRFSGVLRVDVDIHAPDFENPLPQEGEL